MTAMTAVQYAAKCGERLVQAKAACEHGEWLPWLEVNCSFKANKAQKYMRLAENLHDLPNTSDPMYLDSIETAIAYLSASEETREQVDNSESSVSEKQIKEWRRVQLLLVFPLLFRVTEVRNRALNYRS